MDAKPNKPTIFIVEDDPFVLRVYQRKLSLEGIDVALATNGREALDRIMLTMPDLVLLDLVMPQKDGFEVLEELSKSGQISSIPVLIFSTLGQEKDVKQALDLGAKGFVNKSFFDFDSLLVKIKEVAST